LQGFGVKDNGATLERDAYQGIASQAAEKLAFDLALIGRGWKPRRKCRKINPGFSR